MEGLAELNSRITDARREADRAFESARKLREGENKLRQRRKEVVARARAGVRSKLAARLARVASRMADEGHRVFFDVKLDVEADREQVVVHVGAGAQLMLSPGMRGRRSRLVELTWRWPMAEQGDAAALRRRLDGYREIAEAALRAAIAAFGGADENDRANDPRPARARPHAEQSAERRLTPG